MVVVNYYFVTFIISFICWLFFLVSCGQKKMNINLVIIFSVVAVSNGGYLALSLSKNVDIAILSQKIVYLANIYMPLFVFFNVCALCKVNLHKVIRLIMIIFCSIVYGLILTAGYSDLYYKKVYLHNEDGYTYITKDYGPTHNLYSVILYTIMVASLVVIIYALRNQKKASYKSSLLLLVLILSMIVTYFVKMIIGTHIEFMPAIYCVLIMVLFMAYRRVDMYDIGYAILDTLEQQMNGYIVLNKELKYLGANDMAKVYCPYLEEIKIDRSIENDKILFLE